MPFTQPIAQASCKTLITGTGKTLTPSYYHIERTATWLKQRTCNQGSSSLWVPIVCFHLVMDNLYMSLCLYSLLTQVYQKQLVLKFLKSLLDCIKFYVCDKFCYCMYNQEHNHEILLLSHLLVYPIHDLTFSPKPSIQKVSSYMWLLSM